MNNKTKLVVDSSSDISKNLAKEYNISVIPIGVIIDGVAYKDGVDIEADEFYRRMREEKIMPTTSQATPFEFEEFFKEILKEYDEILYISISGNGSGMFQGASLAISNLKHDYPDKKIEILDSCNFSMLYGYASIEAAKLINEGKSIEEAKKRAKEILDNIDVAFGVSTLDYLFKGGRINRASLVLGNILDIRPILSVRDGVISAIDKMRGSKKVAQKLVDYISKKNEMKKDSMIYIIHGDMESEALIAKELCESSFKPKEVVISRIGSTVGTHVGPDVIGIIYEKK